LNTNDLRRIGAAAIAGLLVFFFLPVVYNSTLFACGNGAVACLTNPSGLESLGYWAFHVGVVYGLEPGVGFASIGFSNLGFGGDLTLFGVLLAYVFPSIVACVGLIAPEIVRLSRVTRVGFVAFGLFVAALSAIFVLSWSLPLTGIGVVLLGASWYMVAFGMGIWIFRAEDLPQEQELPNL